MSGPVRRRCDDHDMSRDTSQIGGDRRLWLSEPCPSCGAERPALPNVPPRRQAHALVARRARVASAVVPDLQGPAGRAVPNVDRPARRSSAHRSAWSRAPGTARRRAGMGGARAVACVGGAGSLLGRQRQSRQHLGRHARARGRGAARLLEQRRRGATRGARRPDLGPLRAVPRPAANHRAADVGCAGAVDRDRRPARRPEVRRDPVPSKADRNCHDRVAGGQHAARHVARHVAPGGGNGHLQRGGGGGLANLALVRALWRSVGGGAASGGALLLKALSAGRLPRPALSAVRPRRPDRARALRPLRRPDAHRAPARGALLLKALPAGRLARQAQARTPTKPCDRAALRAVSLARKRHVARRRLERCVAGQRAQARQSGRLRVTVPAGRYGARA